MAVERIYEQQVMPQAGAALPLSRPEDFGAGAFGAAGQLGDEVHQRQVRAYQLDRAEKADAETADIAHKFALHRQNMDGIVRELRANAGPGGAGHAEAVRQANEAFRETLLEGVTEDSVRRQAVQQWDGYSTKLLSDENDFAEGQRIAKQVADRERTADIGFNRIRTSSDPAVYTQELGMQLAAIEAEHGLPDGVKQKLRDRVEQGAAIAFHGQLQDSNPRASRALLDSPAFAHIDPAVLEQLRNGADVEIRRQEAAAAEARRAQQAVVRDSIATLEEADRQGIAVDDSQFGEAVKAAQALGDQSLALKLEGLRENNRFAKVYQGQSPLQREQALAALKAKKAPSDADQRQIKYLEDHRQQWDAEFEADQAGFAMRNAPDIMKPPPGDVTDAGVARARAAWARRASIYYGRPVSPFTKAEAAQLAAIRGGGAGGENTVLALLDQFDEGPDRALAAAQVAPQDKLFQHMAQLNPQSRPTVRAGAQALKDNPNLLKPETDNLDTAETIARVENDLRIALREFEPQDQAAVLALGRQFMAGVLSHRNLTVDDALTESTYRTAMAVALGGGVSKGRGTTGGLGEWTGHPFVLPEGHDNGTFGIAIGKALARDPASRPVNPDGSVIPINRLVPVLIAPGRYRFESDSGRVALRADGRPAVFDVKPIP